MLNRKMTKMDKLILLIHYLDDKEIPDEKRVREIAAFRDDGVITDEEGVDLVIAYDLHI